MTFVCLSLHFIDAVDVFNDRLRLHVDSNEIPYLLRTPYMVKFCASYTAGIHLFEIERRILWLLKIHLLEFKVVFCHL